VTVNYTGAVSAGLAVADRLRAQGHGTLVVLSSVAGVRGRKDNYVYGSTKAGLDAFSEGLGDAMRGTGARVMVVRPGFVTSKMTEGMEPAPFSTTPDAVGTDIVAGLRRRAHTVWSPAVLQAVFGVLRLVPRPLWRRLANR
jgi:decaprenylphospho-beta-D-erythro-pentofuranosid-2-ulose 2-reductase